MYALSNALYVAGGLALLGALLAWILVAPRPDGGLPAEWEPTEVEPAKRAAAAEPIHV